MKSVVITGSTRGMAMVSPIRFWPWVVPLQSVDGLRHVLKWQ
jgi:hypothetical protein